MMRKYQVRFWRAVTPVRESPTLIFNAARNILSRGLGTVGHTGTFAVDVSNALGESTSTLAGEILLKQVGS